MLTRLSSVELALVILAILFGATGLGIWIGRVLCRRRSGLKEPLGIMEAALVGLVALLLAFGLSMAVGRYQSRRDAVVLEANAIGTTYLRAQTLAEPMRSQSLELLKLLIHASALALGSLGMFLASHESGVFMALLAAGLVAVMLLVIFDLDRPERGLITIPDGPVVAVRASMNAPPAASGAP